jgi:hypothetical protein
MNIGEGIPDVTCPLMRVACIAGNQCLDGAGMAALNLVSIR